MSKWFTIQMSVQVPAQNMGLGLVLAKNNILSG